MRPNGRVAWALVGLACLLVWGPGTVGCGPTRKPGQDVAVGLLAAPASLSPFLDRSTAARHVQDAYTRSYVAYHADGRLVAQWATSAPHGPPSFRYLGGSTTEYRLVLRPDARWSDGQPLTSGDFIFAYRMAVHPLYRKVHAAWTPLVRELQMSGSQDLRVLVERNPLENGLALFPMPDRKLEPLAVKDPTHFGEVDYHSAPLSDGPFAIVKTRSSGLDLQRNAYYVPHPAALAALYFKYYGHAEDALADLRDGKIDVVPDLPAERARGLKPEKGFALQRVASPELLMLAFNTRDIAARHASVRRALCLAVDRAALAASLGPDTAIPATSWLPPERAGCEPAFDSLQGGIEAARAGLKTSGWKVSPAGELVRGSEKRIPTLLYDNGSTEAMATAQAVRKAWEALGIHCALDGKAGPAYLDALRHRGFTVAVQGIAVYPWTQPATWFAKESIPTSRNSFRGQNVSGWSTPELQDLLREIAAAAEPASAEKALRQQQKLLAKDVPVLPLFFRPQITAVRTGLSGVRSRGFGGITWNVEEWQWK